MLQARLEVLLAEWAGGRGTDIQRCHEGSTGPSRNARGGVGVAGPAGPLELTAAYVVGCDGEESTVRRLAGIAFPGQEATRELLRTDVAGIETTDRSFQRLPFASAPQSSVRPAVELLLMPRSLNYANFCRREPVQQSPIAPATRAEQPCCVSVRQYCECVRKPVRVHALPNVSSTSV